MSRRRRRRHLPRPHPLNLPSPVTMFERDKCRYNSAWGKYGFEFIYTKQTPDDYQHPDQTVPKEHMICVHNKLGPLCESLRWGAWMPCFTRTPSAEYDGDYEAFDISVAGTGTSDWRFAALASIEPERIPAPKMVPYANIIMACEAWRDPFVCSIVANLLKQSLSRPSYYAPPQQSA